MTTPDPTKLADFTPDVAARIRARTVQTEAGCWEWQGSNIRGYGVTTVAGRKVMTHRAMIFCSGRAIPEGMQADHLCRNRPCCNPDHLEVVTQAENIRRSGAVDGVRRYKASITECPKGHPYSAENTYVCKRGRRSCRICHRARCTVANRRRRAPKVVPGLVS